MNRKFSLAILFLIWLFLSCSANSEMQDTIAPLGRNYVSTEVTYSEPTAQFAFRLNMDSTETEFAKYFFEPNIDDKEREACIKATEKVLSNQAIENTIPEIYVFTRDKYDYKSINDHKLYSSLQEWTSVEYITDVLLTAYGESAHYGTAFGYANYLAKSYNWYSYDGNFSIPSVRDICDLNYLCFKESFAASDDIAIAKEISCDFVESYISKHGEQSFQQLLASHPISIAALTAYYKENNLSYAPSAIQYGYKEINQ